MTGLRTCALAIALSCGLCVGQGSAETIHAWGLHRVESQSLHDVVHAYGRILPPETRELSAPDISVPVVEVLARPGDRVHAGQILVRLDPSRGLEALREAQARYAAAALRVATAEETVSLLVQQEEIQAAAVARYDRVGGQGVIAETKIESVRTDLLRMQTERAKAQGVVAQARSDLLLAEIARDRAQINLDGLSLHAPADGTVLSVDVRPGMASNARMSFLTIAEGRLEATVDVPVARLPDLQHEGSATVILPDGRRLDASLATLPAGSQTGTAKVRLILPSDPGLLPGLPVRAEFAIQEREGIAIPRVALLPMGEGTGVLHVSDGRSEPRSVVLGAPIQPDLIEVRDGLEAGDLIVSNAQGRQRPGQPVLLSTGVLR